MSREQRKQRPYAEAIGSSERVRLAADYRGGPLDWIALGRTVQARLESSGGRPTNPEWDIKRQVPFKRDTWRKLSAKAESLSERGRKIGPAQLSAFLIEEALGSMERGEGDADGFVADSGSEAASKGQSKPQLVLRDGEVQAVILDIREYEELLERAGKPDPSTEAVWIGEARKRWAAYKRRSAQ